MEVILIGGLWLDERAWSDVAEELRRKGHTPGPLTLPGQGDGRSSASLDDQVSAVMEAVDEANEPVLVVGHSAACTLAWYAADRRPEKVARVVMIGGFGRTSGEPYAVTFPVADGVVAFPGWDAFDSSLTADIPEKIRAREALRAVDVPGKAALGLVEFHDERRFDVPVTLICPEFTPEEAREWIDAGNAPELAQVRRLDFVDFDSAHWPMFTKARELAGVLSDIAAR